MLFTHIYPLQLCEVRTPLHLTVSNLWTIISLLSLADRAQYDSKLLSLQ